MASVSTPGKMVGYMKENIKTIRNMVLESIPGLMVDATVDTGVKANSTDSELI